ncbi:hypothetical protein PG997_006729 [Apiospora hydei]|uniref:Uncharacterized protein n=1 Tax=Apiospora hydei TaxID=1337664 RepID=A0ABR1WS44_9PEZI
MASFGKLSTSLIQGVNENTLALANLNFDFSLVKLQAPIEFQQIGPALAERRRHNAEAGTSHQTARKLGALFESLVPLLPRLISAYGQRASEIMKKPGANPPGTTERHGPFAAFVGADATGIWAAATSGQASIATHLLACMLARTFSDPAKAVSVWVELVQERKHEIMAYNTHSTLSLAEFAALNASIQQVTREELRLWDASARAWLQTADSAMRKEHVQLKLIIKNLCIPVTASTSLYTSVTKAWTQALVGSVTSGAILLAISAWHLYPDRLVFTSQTTSVAFSDPLMNPSGVLTVGIINAACTSSAQEGIYWSVALSHYRHYGRPTRAVSEIDDRLTMDELYLVILGGLLKSWEEPRANYEQGSKWFVALWNCVNGPTTSFPGPAWLKPLAGTASRFLSADKQERQGLLSLLDFGFRRGAQFLAARTRKSVNLPWFGLRSPHIFKSLGRSSSKECAIEYLRQTAAACELNPNRTLITAIRLYWEDTGFQQHDYYTAMPICGSQPSKPLEHRSWRGSFAVEGGWSFGVPSEHDPKDTPGQEHMDPITPDSPEATVERGMVIAPLVCRDPQFATKEFVTRCEATLPALENFSGSDVHFAAVVGKETKTFNLWISQKDLEVRQVAQAIQKLCQGRAQPLLDLHASTTLLENGINRRLLWQYLEGADPHDQDDNIKAVLSLMRWERSYCGETVKSLRNLAAAYEVYKTLEGATISSTIISRGIHDAKWALTGSGAS